MIQLTQRQADVFKEYLAGKTMVEIALELKLSYNRVVNILNEILYKSGFSNKRELLANGKDLKIEIYIPKNM